MNLVINDISLTGSSECLACTVNTNELFITDSFSLITLALNSTKELSFQVRKEDVQRIFAMAKLKKVWSVSIFVFNDVVWFSDTHTTQTLLSWLEKRLGLDIASEIKVWNLRKNNIKTTQTLRSA